MNKTISINISGLVFNIEEEAYEQLKQYLDEIRAKFHNEEERDEIMDDIELRIAELFQEQIAPNKEVITPNSIQNIIEILGHPEDFSSDEDNVEEASKKETFSESTTKKQLFRDKDNATIGGVCSGMGHYFDIDPTVFRIIFVFLFLAFGTGLLLYIILLIVVPEAKTTSDKIEMKGESVNLDSIKNHVSNIKQSIAETSKKSSLQIKKTVKNAFDKSVQTSYSFFSIAAKIIGAALIIGGVFWLILLLFVLFGDTGLIPFIGPDRIEDFSTLIAVLYPGNEPSSLIMIAFITVTVIPLLAMIITGVRLVFNYRKNAKQIAWTFGIIWTIGVATLFVFSVGLASDFKSDKEIISSIPLEIDENKELIIEIIDDIQFSNHIDPYNDWNVAEQIKIDENAIYIGAIELIIKPIISGENFSVNITKHSHGSSTREAIKKIENINCPIYSKDNKLLISPYITIPKEDKIRGQYVVVEIFVPRGRTIVFGKNTERIQREFWSKPYYSENIKTNSKWTSDGKKFLRLEDATKNEIINEINNEIRIVFEKMHKPDTLLFSTKTIDN